MSEIFYSLSPLTKFAFECRRGLKISTSSFFFPSDNLAVGLLLLFLFIFKPNKIILTISPTEMSQRHLEWSAGPHSAACPPPLPRHKLKLGWSVSCEGHHARNGAHYQLCGVLPLPPAAAVPLTNDRSQTELASSQRV